MNTERIQKALARQGLGSRRQIEKLIAEGKITLNGNTAMAGAAVKDGDKIMISGRRIIIKSQTDEMPRVIAYHKPVGEVCSRNDPEGRTTIFENLPKLKQSRWVSIGRLDLNTSGLILLTDNGELANRLMHPSHKVAREYAVRTLGRASEDVLKKLTTGVQLEDGKARFEDILDTEPNATAVNHWYHVVLMEGRNREVRRMWEAVGLTVSRLMRVRYGNILMEKGHKQGRVRDIKPKKIIELAAMVGLTYELDEQAYNERQKTSYVKDKPSFKGRAQHGRNSHHDKSDKKRTVRKPHKPR